MKEASSDKFLISRQRMAIIGFLVVLFNPLPAGLIYGFFCWRQPETKRDGKLMLIFSLIWGAISLSIAKRYLGY